MTLFVPSIYFIFAVDLNQLELGQAANWNANSTNQNLNTEGAYSKLTIIRPGCSRLLEFEIVIIPEQRH